MKPLFLTTIFSVVFFFNLSQTEAHTCQGANVTNIEITSTTITNPNLFSKTVGNFIDRVIKFTGRILDVRQSTRVAWKNQLEDIKSTYVAENPAIALYLTFRFIKGKLSGYVGHEQLKLEAQRIASIANIVLR